VFRMLPDRECTVQAKRWKNPDWMQFAANSWRTYSSASTVSCTVCVGKPVHQVGMHQDAGIGEGMRQAPPADRYAFLHQLEQAVGGRFEPPDNRDAAAVGELAQSSG